jgi:putative glycosyltransferase (TIGR04348 family)
MPNGPKPLVYIVTPGTRSANNGNWRTAARWSQLLRDRCRVIVQSDWNGERADALIALHARRSAGAIEKFRAAHPERRIAVVLTGTDLYRDLPGSAEAAASLDHAHRIVTLQDQAANALKPEWRAKTQVIYQSAEPLSAVPKPSGRLTAVAVGHLREEKDPRTLFAAVRALPKEAPIFVRHVGEALDVALGQEARQLEQQERRYTYLGALPRGLARAALKTAHVLVHPSIMEGGANVVVEAITAGTPVIASRIAGNIGMLGADYPGYFEPRDASALAAHLVQALEQTSYLQRLRDACSARAPLFQPEAERRAVTELVDRLVL